jgi:type VI secretion system FHA domain protein
MALVLRIESLQPDVPLALPRDGWVEADHDLKIGRAADNDLVLEDPAGTISKRHCTISRVDEGYVLVDHSRNGTFLNRDSQAMARDVPVPLKPGDAIQVGCFSLAVIAAAVPGTGSAIDPDPVSEDGETTSPAETSFLGAVAPMPSPNAHLAYVEPGGLMSRREEPLVIEDEDYGPVTHDHSDDDPLADPLSERRGVRDHDRGVRDHDDDDPLLGRRLDAGESPRSFSDHVAVPNMVFVQPRLRTEPIPDDWDLMSEMGHSLAPLSPQPVAPELFEEVEAAPPPAPPPPPVAPAQVVPAAGWSGTVEEGAAIAAFLEGCGLSQRECGTADMVTVMRRAGQALRLSVANLHDILAARTSTKEGFGVERTMLGRSRNNPLKFVADPHDALIALLVTTIPGFLVADEAVAQAFTDIKEHQISMVAAMQAALASVCQQLAPETIERAVGASTLPERLMPQRRSARQWQAYKAAFDEVTAGLDNNAREVFGSDFVRAYQHNTASAGGRPSDAEDDRVRAEPPNTAQGGPLPDERRDVDVG